MHGALYVYLYNRRVRLFFALSIFVKTYLLLQRIENWCWFMRFLSLHNYKLSGVLPTGPGLDRGVTGWYRARPGFYRQVRDTTEVSPAGTVHGLGSTGRAGTRSECHKLILWHDPGNIRWTGKLTYDTENQPCQTRVIWDKMEGAGIWECNSFWGTLCPGSTRINPAYRLVFTGRFRDSEN